MAAMNDHDTAGGRGTRERKGYDDEDDNYDANDGGGDGALLTLEATACTSLTVCFCADHIVHYLDARPEWRCVGC